MRICCIPRLLRFVVVEDIRNLAVEDEAEHIPRLRRDRQTLLHPVQRICGNALFVNQMILRQIALLQRPVKWGIGNHDASPMERVAYLIS